MKCTHPDHDCYPYYGGAPGRDFAGPLPESIAFTTADGEGHEVPAGTFAFAQMEAASPEEWPDNFRGDPESDGQLGVWFCPTCKAGIDG